MSLEKARKKFAANLAFGSDTKMLKEAEDRIDKGLCPACGKDPKIYPDDFDPNELKLSGICDDCWHKMFSGRDS